MIKVFWNWGGGVVGAASLVLGGLSSPEATRDVVAWASPWGIEPLHLAFWLLAFGAVWTAVAQAVTNRRLDQRRPRITVEARVYRPDGRAVLRVTNHGRAGTFKAIREIVTGDELGYPMTAYWEQQGAEAMIHGDGGQATLLVAESREVGVPPSVRGYALFVAGVGNDGEVQWHRRAGWSPFEEADADHVPPVLRIAVTITADPPLSPARFKSTYALEQSSERRGLAEMRESP